MGICDAHSQCRWPARIHGKPGQLSGFTTCQFSPSTFFSARPHRACPSRNFGSRIVSATSRKLSLEYKCQKWRISSVSELRNVGRLKGSVVHAVRAGMVSSNGRASASREEHLERLEEFYNGSDFLFVDEEWNALRPDAGKPGAASSCHESLKEKWSLLLAGGRVRADSRVLIWGGSPAFAQQLCRVVSPASLVVAHLSLSVLAAIKEMDDGVTCWHGDIQDFPQSYGPFDVVFLNSLLAAVYSPDHALQAVAGLCETGGRILVCYAQGKEDLKLRKNMNPDLILCHDPDALDLENVIKQLPLALVNIQDEPGFFLATLEVTGQTGPSLADRGLETVSNARSATRWTSCDQKFPLCAGGHIVQGFGRGSKQMGVPTANIDPSELPREICELSKGVYFGWAQLVNAIGLDGEVHKMVMNVGNRPTFEEAGQVTVEVNIRHSYTEEFYGEELRIIVLGFIRDEMKFNSLGDLVRRINTDIAIAEKVLDEDDMLHFATDPFFGKG